MSRQLRGRTHCGSWYPSLTDHPCDFELLRKGACFGESHCAVIARGQRGATPCRLVGTAVFCSAVSNECCPGAAGVSVHTRRRRWIRSPWCDCQWLQGTSTAAKKWQKRLWFKFKLLSFSARPCADLPSLLVAAFSPANSKHHRNETVAFGPDVLQCQQECRPDGQRSSKAIWHHAGHLQS